MMQAESVFQPENAFRLSLFSVNLFGDYFAFMTNVRRGAGVEPREIFQEDDATLRITWGDGRICRYQAPQLRRLCPCAQCVNEFTGERTLRPEIINEDLTIADLGVVGRYALNFRWSDRHDTGIYSFRLLREICEGEETGDRRQETE